MTQAIIIRKNEQNVIVAGGQRVVVVAGSGLLTSMTAQAKAAMDAAAASAALAESASGPTYANTTAGLAATTDGEGFAVDNGDGTVTVYLNDSGSAVAQRTLATTAFLASTAGAAQVGTSDGGTVQDVIDDLGTASQQNADDMDIRVSVMRRPGFYNIRSSSFLRWSAALSAHRAGVSRAYIACIGDSTTRGVGSNPSSATEDLIRRSWPSVMADALNQMPNTKATANSLWCDGFFTLVGSGNLAIADPRVSWETGWQTHATMFVAGGKSFQYPDSASGTGRFNVDFTVGATGPFEDDTCDVFYVKSPGFGDLLLTTNDAAEYVNSVSTSAANGVGKLTGTRSGYKDTAWTIQRAAGTPDVNLIFYGIESYKAADKPIGVWNMGASGSLAANWVDDNQPYNFVNALPDLAPNLTIICLTINDWANDTAEATYKANMQMIIDAAIETGDVLLVVGVPSNTGTAPVDRQQRFAGYVRDLADTNDLPVIDLSERWVSQALLADRGIYYDGLHPSNVGHYDIGYMLAQFVGNPGYYLG